MITGLIGLAVTWLPRLAGALGGIISGGAAVSLAIVTAIPATVTAIGTFFANLAEALKNPVFALLFGAAVSGASGFLYGLSFDAGLRAKAETAAITSANRRADAAIGKIRADYEKRMAGLAKGRK